MSLESIQLLQNPDQFLIEILKRETGLIGGFGKFMTPNKEENDEYKENIVYQLVEQIWKQELQSLKLKKIDLYHFTIPIPQTNASNLLLVSSQIVSGTNYEAIVSVILNDISRGIKTNYYKIKYYVPLP